MTPKHRQKSFNMHIQGREWFVPTLFSKEKRILLISVEFIKRP